ncbi:MAG: ROK family protein [Patescibacteria group bacterium]
MHILFDIGGTNTRIAISRDGDAFKEPRVVATPQKFEEGIALVGNIAKELIGAEKGSFDLSAAAGGVAGPFNREKTILVNAPNLPDWKGKPLKKELEDALGTTVILENDAALAGIGEATVGAGKGKDIVAYMTVGTGVGGARIVHGHIDESAFGFEPGHQYIQHALLGEDIKCWTLESLVSGSALQKRFDKDPREIADPAVWEDLAKLLAVGLHNTIVHWSPDIVVLGGSIIRSNPALPLDRVIFHLKNIHSIFGEPPPLVPSEHGDQSALYGALVLLTR